MLHIVYGVYHWRAKRLAFRNDYCLACAEARRAVQVRTFDVGHIYWIPILPAGFWKHWQCTVCGRDPHVSTKTRRGFKWAGLFILLLFSAAFWAMPDMPDFVAGTWILRIAAPVGAVLTLLHLLRTPKEPSLKARLATIQPAADTVCPFCGAQLLMLGSRSSCPSAELSEARAQAGESLWWPTPFQNPMVRLRSHKLGKFCAWEKRPSTFSADGCLMGVAAAYCGFASDLTQ